MVSDADRRRGDSALLVVLSAAGAVVVDDALAALDDDAAPSRDCCCSRRATLTRSRMASDHDSLPTFLPNCPVIVCVRGNSTRDEPRARVVVAGDSDGRCTAEAETKERKRRTSTIHIRLVRRVKPVLTACPSAGAPSHLSIFPAFFGLRTTRRCYANPSERPTRIKLHQSSRRTHAKQPARLFP